jgi:hypothetical protein
MSVNYSSSLPVARTKKKLCAYQTDGTNVSLEFDLDVKVNTSTATGTISVDAIETLELSTNSTSPVADITRTLPDVTTVSGFIVTVKKLDSSTGAVVVQGHGSPADAIDGGTTWTLSNQYQYVRLLSDGTKWHVIGNN